MRLPAEEKIHMNAAGRIEVICGCMFAGKTSTLLDRLLAARDTGMTVVAFKHAIDTRYAVTRIVTHDGRGFDALPAPDAAGILAQIERLQAPAAGIAGSQSGDGRNADRRVDEPRIAGVRDGSSAAPQVVGIDEAHFFGRPLAEACVRLKRRNIRVILTGLHNDAWGRPFPPFPELRDIADSIQVLCAPCRKCGAPAEYSQRMVPVTDPFMIGGLGEYEPRCRTCFESLPPPAPAY